MLREMVLSGDVTKDYDLLMKDFQLAFEDKDLNAQDLIEHTIFIRQIMKVFNIECYSSVTAATTEESKGHDEEVETFIAKLIEKIVWVRDEYCMNHIPGDAVPPLIQLLKGCLRETECDRVWALSDVSSTNVHHLRSHFYTDDFFTPLPSVEQDAGSTKSSLWLL